MDTQRDIKLLEVFPYRNSGIQIALGSSLFIPASIFMIYAPFRDPCSLDRTSGDCSFGSPLMEQFYTIFMVSFGILTILACLHLIRKFFRNQVPRQGCRIAFTEDSIIGPIWGFWSSSEGEIKFSEITDFSIVQSRYAIFMQVTSTSKKMMLQSSFLMNDDSFRRVFNNLARALQKPFFEESVTPEVAKSFVPFKTQLEEQKHLIAAFAYFSIGGILTLFFGSYVENQNDGDLHAIGFLIPFAGLCYIVSLFYKKVWNSNMGQIDIFLFFMLFGLFVGFIGTVGLLSY